MPNTTLIVCAYRGVSVPTHHAIVQLVRKHPEWDEVVVEQAPINRARSYAASQWYRKRPDEDVFVMVDDDLIFEIDTIVRLAEFCRDGHDVIGGLYSFRDGSSVAVRLLRKGDSLACGEGLDPQEVRHVGTGFFAVHRRVIEAMTEALPLCSDRRFDSAFWPLFQDRIVEDDAAATGSQWLTEDYDFCERARELGFKVWVDRSAFLAHYGQVPVTLNNMATVRTAIQSTFKVAAEA